MHLNPILKNVLVRTAYIVGSFIMYCLLTAGTLLINNNYDDTRFFVFWIGQTIFILAALWSCIYKLDSLKPLIAVIRTLLICYIVYRSIDYLDFSYWKDKHYHYGMDGHPTLRTSLQMTASAILIWINIRKLSLPVKRVYFALFLLIPTILIGAWKTSISGLFDPYDYVRELARWGVISVLASSLLPLFFTGKEVIKLDRISKIGLWGTVLLLDFVIAMPNIRENESIKPQIYYSYYGNFFMTRKANDCFLLSMQDSQKCSYYEDGLALKRHYSNNRDSLWISYDKQDTLYIQRSNSLIGYRVSHPNGETHFAYPYSDFVEEATNCWQYNAWQKIKGTFRK